MKHRELTEWTLVSAISDRNDANMFSMFVFAVFIRCLNNSISCKKNKKPVELSILINYYNDYYLIFVLLRYFSKEHKE